MNLSGFCYSLLLVFFFQRGVVRFVPGMDVMLFLFSCLDLLEVEEVAVNLPSFFFLG